MASKSYFKIDKLISFKVFFKYYFVGSSVRSRLNLTKNTTKVLKLKKMLKLSNNLKKIILQSGWNVYVNRNHLLTIIY